MRDYLEAAEIQITNAEDCDPADPGTRALMHTGIAIASALIAACEGLDFVGQQLGASQAIETDDNLVRRYNDLERLLLDLTPGGSEFAGDPEACAHWVRERLSSTGRLAAERNRLRTVTEAASRLFQHRQSGDEHPVDWQRLDKALRELEATVER